MPEEQNKVNEAQASPMGDVLGTILSNPDLMRRIGSIMGAMASAPAASTSEISSDAPDSSSVPASAPPLSDTHEAQNRGDGLATLLSDPAMLEKLPQMISVIKPLLSSIPTQKPSTPHNAEHPQDSRDHLLLALKPFLSPQRRDAVDTIIRLSHLGNVFNQLK